MMGVRDDIEFGELYENPFKELFYLEKSIGFLHDKKGEVKYIMFLN